MTKLYLTIEYKNGNTLTEKVNYLHFENENLFYTVDKQIYDKFIDQIKIPIENIKKFDLEYREV